MGKVLSNLIILLSLTSVCFPELIIDTTTTWSGNSMGTFGQNSMVGQTFGVDPSNNRLDYFTFYAIDSNGYMTFNFHLMEWSISSFKPVGSVLFETGPKTSTNNQGQGGWEKITFETGGIELDSSKVYIAIISVPDSVDGSCWLGHVPDMFNGEFSYASGGIETATTVNWITDYPSFNNEMACEIGFDVFVLNPDIIYVDDDNISGPWYGTEAKPYQYIQDGINISSDGTKIIVMPGDYQENLVVEDKDITITCYDPNDPNSVTATVIDGSGLDSVMAVTNSDLTIEGFTITNGLADTGGGIYCDNSNLAIYNCVITANGTNPGLAGEYGTSYGTDGTDGGDGGGLWCLDSNVEIKDSTVAGNTTGTGGKGGPGKNNGGTGGNSGSGAGVYCLSTSLSIMGCEISGNTTGTGGIGGEGDVEQDTGGTGGGSGSGAGIYSSSSTLSIMDCEISENATGPGGTGGAGQYVGGDGGSTGSGAGIYSLSTSLSVMDCGISKNVTGPGGNVGNGLFGIKQKQHGGTSGSGGGLYCDAGSLAIERCIISGNKSGKGGSASIKTEWDGGESGNGAGIYCININDLIFNYCMVTDNVVGYSGCGSGYGGSYGGNTGIGGGTYISSSNKVVINCCMFLRNKIEDSGLGEFGGSGGDGGGLYCLSSICVILKDCQFNNNQSGNGGDGWSVGGSGGNGGGAAIISPIAGIINCRFLGNKAGYGGEIVEGGDGGALFCSEDVNIQNSLFVLNSSGTGFQSGGNGGGIYTGNSVTLTNCTVANNSASKSYIPGKGGGVYSESSSDVTNSILWNNVANDINDQVAQIGGGDITVNYSCLQGWTGSLGGIGNIGVDPLFADPNNIDFHLKSKYGRWDSGNIEWFYDVETSPCIDSGDPCDLNWKDELWPHGKRINMGAYGGTNQASLSGSDVGLGADINRDGKVDKKDFSKLSSIWANSSSEIEIPSKYDLNYDITMNLEDFILFAEEWLMSENDKILKGYWKFDEIEGQTARDYSAYKNHGTLHGPGWTGNGQLGFDGIDDYVEVPHSDSLNISGEITVSAWIYLNDYADYWTKIVIKPHTDTSEPWEMFALDLYREGPFPRFIINNGIADGKQAIAMDDTFALNLNQWYHLSGTYDGSVIALYVDGQLIASDSSSVTLGQNTMPISIGGRLGTYSFDGLIDDVRIYNKALDESEIHEIYENH